MKRFLLMISALMILIGAAAMLSAAADNDPAPTEAPTDAPVAAYPEIVSITPDSSGFTLQWTAYPGAAQYRLFVRGASGWNRVGDTAATTLRHPSLKDQTTYIYTVRALDRSGKYISSYDVAGWSKVFRAAPELTSVNAVGNTLKITWKRIPDAPCYRVYRRQGASWVGIGFSDGGSYVDENVVSGRTYAYTVRAFDADRKTILSAFQPSGISGTYADIPMIANIEANNSGVRITWGKVNGAPQYRVFVKAANGWRAVGSTSDTTFVYQNAAVGVASTYTVRAMNSSGAYISDFSREGMAHTLLRTPKLLSLTNLVGGQKLSWQRVPGAQLYRVYIRDGSTWKKLADTADTSYTLNNVRNNAAYCYTVRCMSPDGRQFCSGFQPSGLILRYFDAPRITSVENVREGARITWKKIPGAPRYRIFTKAAAGWKKIADVTSTDYLHSAAVQGTDYIYTVRALDNAGSYISSFIAAGYANHYQTAPLLIGVSPSPEGAVLTWTEYGGAERYRVFRRYLDTQWRRLADVDGLTFTDASAPEGTPCQYTLRCLDAEGNLTSDYYDNKIFYCDGDVADGRIIVNGYRVTFSKGTLTKGYVTAQDIYRIALAEVGTKAKNYKRCKYNTWYYGAEVSGEDYDWCVVFFEWVFHQANAIEMLHGKTAGAELLGAQFYRDGQLVKSGYRFGDLVLIHWRNAYSDYVPGVKVLNHVGFVVSVNGDGTVTTIEGNTGSPNGEVMIKTRRMDQISCACRPKYGFTIPVS